MKAQKSSQSGKININLVKATVSFFIMSVFIRAAQHAIFRAEQSNNSSLSLSGFCFDVYCLRREPINPVSIMSDTGIIDWRSGQTGYLTDRYYSSIFVNKYMIKYKVH